MHTLFTIVTHAVVLPNLLRVVALSFVRPSYERSLMQNPNRSHSRNRAAMATAAAAAANVRAAARAAVAAPTITKSNADRLHRPAGDPLSLSSLRHSAICGNWAM